MTPRMPGKPGRPDRKGISPGLVWRLRAVERDGATEFAWSRFEAHTQAFLALAPEIGPAPDWGIG